MMHNYLVKIKIQIFLRGKMIDKSVFLHLIDNFIFYEKKYFICWRISILTFFFCFGLETYFKECHKWTIFVVILFLILFIHINIFFYISLDSFLSFIQIYLQLVYLINHLGKSSNKKGFLKLVLLCLLIAIFLFFEVNPLFSTTSESYRREKW